MTQQDFAKEIKVAFSTVNRWEGGKAKPNLNAMKNIKEFCLEHDVDYERAEEAWLDFEVEGKR
ncbi:helix-turn-helix domain-containing protein [Granulicatella elegans]|nr:helix-turn-helix domain-containing protein [Granulicatella elegans]